MHGVAEAGSVRVSQWLRREHAAYMATPLLALDAWVSRNIKKRARDVSSWPDLMEGKSAWARNYAIEI